MVPLEQKEQGVMLKALEILGCVALGILGAVCVWAAMLAVPVITAILGVSFVGG